MAAELEAQLSYARAQLEADVLRGSDDLWYVMWKYGVPEPWRPAVVELVIQLPPAYPAQAPSGFDVVMPIGVTSGQAMSGTGQRELLGRTCMHFCWNPQGTLDYTAEDGLWRFAKFVETRFFLPQ